ncbi:MAG: hypothetical protein ACHQNV_05320 [Vicinamibacteria bacterium]
MTIPVAHEDELRATFVDPAGPAVQLHRLLAAEHSAEMAEENQDDRAIRPQLPEVALVAVKVADDGASGWFWNDVQGGHQVLRAR